MSVDHFQFLSQTTAGVLVERASSNCRSCKAELWMKSFYGPEAITSSGVDANFSRQWGLRSASSTVWSGGCMKMQSVDLKDREGRLKQYWDAQLSRSSNPKLRLGSSVRRSRVKVRIAGRGWTSPSLDYSMYQFRERAVLTPEGPSCIFVGPLETAEKKRLEALYQQARDAYYSGRPLIVDDMFDRVEMLALASIWSVLLASGVVAAAFPPVCAINKACQEAVHVRFESHGENFMMQTVMAMNGALAIGMGLVIGIPVALAAARSLQGLWRGDLVALKGFCPNCGEEVYAFVAADQPEQPQHKTECHVCEHPLVFRANVERSVNHPGRLFAYGRVYLSTRSKDLAPNKSS